MKTAISIGLRNAYGSYELIEITSKDRYYYYGRTSDGRQTRGALRDLRGEYETAEKANGALKDIREAIFATEQLFRAAKEARNKADDARQAAINEAIKRHAKETAQ